MNETIAPSAAALEPPRALERPHVLELHGERLDDPYHWLRERADPEVRAYLEAENAYAASVAAPLAGLRGELEAELRARLAEDDSSAPYLDGEWLYYWRTERGKQHKIYCRRRSSSSSSGVRFDDAPEQVVLDLNAHIGPGGYVALGDFEVSDDGRLLAYTLDQRGFREYTLRVLDLERGELLADTIERVTSVAWAADGASLVYATEDAAKRPWRVHRHRLGDAGAEALLYEERDERFRVGVERTRSGAWIVLQSASHTASEVRLLSAADVETELRLVAARAPEHEYSVEDAGDRLIVRSNRAGRNFALYQAPLDARGPAPGIESWVELQPHDPATFLERVDAFAGRLVVTERHRGLPRFRILENGGTRFVGFPESVYDAAPGPNERFDATSFRYVYQSLTTPPSVFDHDFATGDSHLVKRDPVPGFLPELYVTERIDATAADGTRVPISLVRRRDTALPAPALLKGYGAYGITYTTTFDRNAISLLDRGLVVAIAHVRGGGDLGQPWHDAGRMRAKPNTFSDFVACAEELIARGAVAPGRLAIAGGSAGGLLIGAVLNARPELFAAAILLVPFVDVVRTMSDPSLPLTVGEFEEWGDPAIEEQYRWIRAYSPYDNLAPGSYPAILVRTSFWDSQVMYWEPAKYVARLRRLKQDDRPLLLVTNLDAGGHGGFAGRYDRLKDTAFDYAFLLDALVAPEPAG
jgi:oligopeptidase B